MSDQTRQALEDAISAHMLDETGEDQVVLSEWIVITASQYMSPDKEYITGYNWACTKTMSHSHILGLLQMGTNFVNDSVVED